MPTRIAKRRRLPYTSAYDGDLDRRRVFHPLQKGVGRYAARPRSVYENKALTCKDCGNSFDFSVRDQIFYAEKGFENEPQRCRECRATRKSQRSDGGDPRDVRHGVRTMQRRDHRSVQTARSPAGVLQELLHRDERGARVMPVL